MTILEAKKKHRGAALKAWKTIRKKKREKAAKDTQKITKFITPEAIHKIKHPELADISRRLEPAWKGNRIVMPFDKTPSDIGCGRFWELRWAYGCPLNCSYCFLRGTTRGRMQPQYVRIEHVLDALDEAFRMISTPSIFNAGELSDALMNPKIMAQIVDKFEEQSKHKIYLLTKFGVKNIEFLLEKPRKQVICGWSINAPVVSKQWERIAAPPNERIEAARLVSTVGYDTRVRIDPIFPVKDWMLHYGNLVDQIFGNFTPNRIILGTPRGLWKTIKYAKDAGVDMSWTWCFKEDSSWGKKLAFEQRKEIYQFLFDKLNLSGYPLSKVSICKETKEILDALGLAFFGGSCNCYGKNALNS
jgi:DNA repair photolyase